MYTYLSQKFDQYPWRDSNQWSLHALILILKRYKKDEALGYITEVVLVTNDVQCTTFPEAKYGELLLVSGFSASI